MNRRELVRRSSVVLCALVWALGCDGPITCPEGTALAGNECVAIDAGVTPELDGATPPMDAASPLMDAASPMMDAATPAPDGGPMPMEDGGMPPPLPDAGPPTCSDPDTWYRDFDMDGQGDSSASVESCDPVAGFVMNADDCNDTCATCFDGAEETCDARDNDCDGVVDDGVTTAYYLDADGDGHGSTAFVMNGCSMPAGYVASADDCDDTCDVCWTGASESCDGEDNDCDGSSDEGVTTTYFQDADGDGRGNPAASMPACSMPAGYVSVGNDCDDTCDVCWTGASESCDGEDNDCDGSSDEGVTTTYYLDADRDGRGDPTRTTAACSAPTGHVENANDCDDGCSVCWTGAVEVCDTRDNDCEGGVDEGVTSTFYRDVDGDGFGNAGMTTQACAAPSGYVANSTDCNDACATCNPSRAEICDGFDNDCDSIIDDGVRITFYRDDDGDGHGGPVSAQHCAMPLGFVTSSDDCNDACPTCYPGRAEVCDGLDNNCASGADEGVTTTYYRDADGDGHGVSTDTRMACTAPSGYVVMSGDCNDAAATVYPGRAETCNALDDDCDGMPDETFSCVRGAPTTCTTSCGSTGSGLCTATCNLPAGASCNPPGETCNGVDDDCDGLADENLFTEGTPLVTSYPVNFQRPKTIAWGGSIYSFWESAGSVSGWRHSQDGTTTATAQIPLGGSARYDVDGSAGSLGIAHVDIPAGGTTGPVVVRRLSSSLGTSWTRTIAINAYQVEIAVGLNHVFVFTRESPGRIYRRVLSLTNGALVGSAELLGSSSRPFDVTDDDGDNQLVAFFDLDTLNVIETVGTTVPSLSGSITHTPSPAQFMWDVAVDSSWTGSASVPNFVAVFSTIGFLSSDADTTNIFYLSHRAGAALASARISTGSTPNDSDDDLTGAMDIEYADGIYLLGAPVTVVDPAGATGEPFAYQLTTRATGATLDVRTIDLNLPVAAHDSISVVRFPDGVSHPDRVFYNPSVNGIASIPIGCY